MQSYVALVADMTGRYAWVYGTAIDWSSLVDQIEEVGCEVIENQTDDYEPIDELTLDDLHEYDVITVQELITHTDAVLA
jgi:2-polyprenyl-3-methyl-5-hydroxy-6-metoxy-1,4-benzoquinol methylase